MINFARYSFLALLLGLTPAQAQTHVPAPAQVQDAPAVPADFEAQLQRALTFIQHDHNSLYDAQGDFTPGGWEKFINAMTKAEMLQNDAPSVSYTFTPTDIPLVGEVTDTYLQVIALGQISVKNDDRAYSYIANVEVKLAKDSREINPPMYRIESIIIRTPM